MIRPFLFTAFLFFLTFSSYAQQKHNPAVKEFGGIYDIPEADKRPDPQLEYKLVIDLTEGAETSEEVNRALNNIARTLNLHVQGGVPIENLKVAAVVHSAATPLVLSNNAYRKKFGVDNPNDQLIQALNDVGVELYVCGQSLIGRGYAQEPLHPGIKVSFSAMTLLTEYQLKGYALLKFY